MDRALGTSLTAQLGIFERTTIILTSDHGMTHARAVSMPELLSQFSRAGLKAEVLDMDDQPSVPQTRSSCRQA